MTHRSPGRHTRSLPPVPPSRSLPPVPASRSTHQRSRRTGSSAPLVGIVLASLLTVSAAGFWSFGGGDDELATASSRSVFSTSERVRTQPATEEAAKVAETAPTADATQSTGTAAATSGSTSTSTSTATGTTSTGGTTSAGTTAAAASVAPSGGTPTGDGILLSHAQLMALPTSGPGWDALVARVASPYGGAYSLGVRDDSNKDVLANALVGARTNRADLKGFVRDRIAKMMTTPRNSGDVLATLRQLQAYVISADVIELKSFDPALDGKFRVWLAAEVRAGYSGGGGGGSVISTHDRKPNNFGTHAGAARLAAALYLGDAAEYKAARDVWYGWATGDQASVSATRAWSGTTWQCGDGRSYGINPVGCSRGGASLDGVIPEDQRRCGEFSATPCATNYIHGATDGMTLSFWIMARRGEKVWEWGDRAALRQMQWKYRAGQPPYSGFRWQIPVIEKAYGIDLPGNAPTATSTNMGYADWWAQ